MQEISRTGRLKKFLVQRKKGVPSGIDTSVKINIGIKSPGSAGTPSSPIHTTPELLRLALSNIELHKIFIEYAQKEYKYECILVWDNIQRYKRAMEREIKSDVARFIYDTFLSTKDGAICTRICESVHNAIENNEFTDEIFDELEGEMENQLTPIFTKFSQSKAYLDFMKQGTNPPVVNRQILMKRPSLSKLRLDHRDLTLAIDTKREMSPGLGSREMFVGSTTVASPMLLKISKSPVLIKSPTVGDIPRFAHSAGSEPSTPLRFMDSTPYSGSEPTTPMEKCKEQESLKRVALPAKDFITSLLSLKKRKL